MKKFIIKKLKRLLCILIGHRTGNIEWMGDRTWGHWGWQCKRCKEDFTSFD